MLPDHPSPLLRAGASATIGHGELVRRCEHLRWLICDVDGVLTDGRLLFFDLPGDGPAAAPAQAFDIKDGLALKLAQGAGLKVGLLSGRTSPAAARRARDLGLDLTWLGRAEKGPAFAELLASRGLTADEVAYIGDDLPDLPVLRQAGVAAAPADAAPEVQATAHIVLARPGGRGAVRELVELLLGARGAWDDIVDRFAAG